MVCVCAICKQKVDCGDIFCALCEPPKAEGVDTHDGKIHAGGGAVQEPSVVPVDGAYPGE